MLASGGGGDPVGKTVVCWYLPLVGTTELEKFFWLLLPAPLATLAADTIDLCIIPDTRYTQQATANTVMSFLKAPLAFYGTSAVVVLAFLFPPVLSFASHYWHVLCLMFIENKMLQAFLVPGFLTCISYGGYKVVAQFDSVIRKRLLRTITIKKQDDNFDVVVRFITEKFPLKSHHVQASTKKKRNMSWSEYRELMLGKVRAKSNPTRTHPLTPKQPAKC